MRYAHHAPDSLRDAVRRVFGVNEPLVKYLVSPIDPFVKSYLRTRTETFDRHSAARLVQPPGSISSWKDIACLTNKDETPGVMSLALNLAQQREAILRLAKEHGAYHVRVFGSAARGETRSSSDLDLLVSLESGRSLLDHIALQQDLEDLLGIPIDVVTEKALHPLVRQHILDEAVPL